MTDNQPPEPSSKPADEAAATAAQREYDRSGFYPAEGKKFRVWALLGWNALVIVILALLAALLNYLAGGGTDQ